MAASISAATTFPDRAIPAALLNVCFVLFVINVAFFPMAYVSHWWIWDPKGGASRPISSTSGPPAGSRSRAIRRRPGTGISRGRSNSRCFARISRLFRLALSAAVPVRRVPAGAVPLYGRLHRLGLGEPCALSRHDARDRRPQLRLAAGDRRFRWCSTTRWSDRTAF